MLTWDTEISLFYVLIGCILQWKGIIRVFFGVFMNHFVLCQALILFKVELTRRLKHTLVEKSVFCFEECIFVFMWVTSGVPWHIICWLCCLVQLYQIDIHLWNAFFTLVQCWWLCIIRWYIRSVIHFVKWTPVVKCSTKLLLCWKGVVLVFTFVIVFAIGAVLSSHFCSFSFSVFEMLFYGPIYTHIYLIALLHFHLTLNWWHIFFILITFRSINRCGKLFGHMWAYTISTFVIIVSS